MKTDEKTEQRILDNSRESKLDKQESETNQMTKLTQQILDTIVANDVKISRETVETTYSFLNADETQILIDKLEDLSLLKQSRNRHNTADKVLNELKVECQKTIDRVLLKHNFSKTFDIVEKTVNNVQHISRIAPRVAMPTVTKFEKQLAQSSTMKNKK